MPAPSAISWPLSPEGIASSKAARTSSAIGTRASAWATERPSPRAARWPEPSISREKARQIRTGQNYRRRFGGA